MHNLTDGASVAVSIPAGSTLKLRGSGVLTFGPGLQSGQSHGIGGQASVGPFGAAVSAYLTGASGLRWQVYNIGSVATVSSAYTADPEDGGATLLFPASATMTFNAGSMADDWNCIVRSASAATASIASDGVFQLNGGTSTLTRAAQSFAIFKDGTNSVTVSGS